MYVVLDFSSAEIVHFWAGVLLLFRSLPRVSHAVISPHTLRISDVKFTTYGCDIYILFKDS